MQKFVSCTMEIKNYGKVAFQKGHVYIAEQKPNTVKLMSDLDSLEIYPTTFFERHFKILPAL